MTDKPLQGRVALVTGSGRNLGRAMAHAMARAGATLIINGHTDQAAVDRVVGEIRDFGGTAMGIMADVGKREQIFDMVKQATDAFGKVDISISNASIRRPIPFLELTEQQWQDTLRTNLSAAVYLAQAVLPGMRAQKWGRIIHISGGSTFFAYAKQRVHNTAAKAGLHGLTKSLAREFGPDGITVNTLGPGIMATERDWSLYKLEAKGDDNDAVVAEIPARRRGMPDEIAATCMYLVSDGGAYTSGQVIHVNGGHYVV
jgi:NAD(P)-dependent dehydrogenase (short-subunit alcohol dehydrogenase family)